MGGANVFVARSDGDAMCAAIAAFGCTAASSSARWSTRSSRPTPTARLDLSTFRGLPRQPGVRRDGATRPVAVGSQRRRLRAERSDGHGDVQPARRPTAIGTHGRPSPLVQLRVVDEDDDEVPAGDVGEIAVRGHDRDERLLEPRRAQRRALAQRLAPHQRSRPLRSRRHVLVHRAEGPHAEVGGGEHLSGRGRERGALASRGRRLRGDRRARRHVGADREGDRRAAPTARRSTRGRDHRVVPRRASRRTRSRARSSSSTRSPAPASSSTTTSSTAASAAATIPAAPPAAPDRPGRSVPSAPTNRR